MRPEIVTSAVLAAAGLGVALWLAATKTPLTPVPPEAPEALAMTPAIGLLPKRGVPEASPTGPITSIAVGPNGVPCGATLTAVPTGEGFADILVASPCRPGETFEFVHGPLEFAERLSDRGTARFRIPLLTESEGYAVTFEDAEALSAGPVGAAYIGMVSGLRWQFPLDLDLEAFEFGAAPGGPGHVTPTRPGGGEVMQFGTSGLGAATALYVGPKSGGPGRVRLRLGAHLTRETCDQAFRVRTFSGAPVSLRGRDIRLTLGSCNEAPARLELKNLAWDLTISPR